MLFRRALAYPDLRDRYLQVLEDCARSAADEDWLATEIERQVSLIGDAAHDDPLKQFSNEEFDRQIEFLREFATIRSAFVLAGSRGPPPGRWRDTTAPRRARQGSG